MDIFDALAANAGELGEALAARHVVDRRFHGEALSRRTVVVSDLPPADFHILIRELDTSGVLDIVERVHGAELQRAAVPPVLNVTVTPPEGTPAMAGHLQVDTGSQPTVTWVPPSDPRAYGPSSLPWGRRVLRRLIGQDPPPEPPEQDDGYGVEPA